jgi:cell division septum initiation protein DivIVA
MGNRFRLAAAILGCSLAATGAAPVSSAQPGDEDRTVTSERRERPPSKLWQEFPLGKPTVTPPTPQSDRVPQPREPVTFESEGEELSSGELLKLLLLLAGLTALVLLGPAVFVLVRPRRPAEAGVAATPPAASGPQRRRATASSPDGSAYVALQRALLLAAMRRPGTARERVNAARAVAMEALECDMVSYEDAEGRQEPVEEKNVRPAVERGDVGEAAVQHKSAPPDVTQVGDRVAAVLRAAEEAAEQIRMDAQAAAEQMTRQAEQEAKARLEEARKEADRVRTAADAESESTRDAIQLYATNHRREAEEKAARLLSDAEMQARSAREVAEAMVQRIQESARSLEEEVREQERMVRGRMQRYLAGLRDVSGQIEGVLAETERGAPPLVEALNVERANQHD